MNYFLPVLAAMALFLSGCGKDTATAPEPKPASESASLPQPIPAAEGSLDMDKPTSEDTDIMITEGKQVALEYTLKLDNGDVADSNVGGEPLAFAQGSGMLLPKFEEAIEGLKVDDTKQFTLSAEDGYGVVNKDAFQEIPLDQIPEDSRKAGALLTAQAESGQTTQVKVHEVKEDVVVLDFNHPLAGETLHFDIKVVSVE